MDEESGLAVPQHRDAMCRNQKQLPDGSAPGLGAARTRADVSPLGLASRRLPEPSGLQVCRGQRAPVQAHCSAACWHRPRTAALWGMGRQEPKLCCSCVRIYASLGGSFSPFIGKAVSVVLGLFL